MKKYTEEEFLEEFGDVKLIVNSYYKYSFGYSGEKDGKKIYVSIGGNADDIYRFDASFSNTILLSDLNTQIDINHGSVYENEVQIGEYCNKNY